MFTIDQNSCNSYGESPTISDNQNYIHTRTYTKDDGSTFLDVIQYYDGLGRPNQTVQVGITPYPDYNDLLSLQEYDPIGREGKSWLPAVTSGNGAYVADPITAITNYYSSNANISDTHPYSKPVYEASPLNRVLEQYGPGQDWHAGEGHSVKTNYITKQYL